MKISHWIRILSGALALATGGAGLRAQEIDAQISSDFVGIVGSEDQADALLVGLRNGTPVSLLAQDGRTVTIIPVSGPLGWGNAYIALSLAQEEFEQFGIANPNVVQLAVVLDGGDLVVNGSPMHVEGILRLFASTGNDWDRVATTIRVDFGPVREHWRTYEGRFERSGGRARLEDRDRPKGEAGWAREQQNPQPVDRGSQGQEERSRQNAQEQEPQNPEQQNINREQTNAARERESGQQAEQSQQRDQQVEQQNINREQTNAARERQSGQQVEQAQQRDQQNRQDEQAREREQQRAIQSPPGGNGAQQLQPREQQSRGQQNQQADSSKKNQQSTDQKDKDKKKPDQPQDDQDHPHN